MLYWDWARMDRVLKLIQKIDYPPALDEDDCASMSKLRTLNPVDQFVALRKKDPQMFMSWLQYSNNASNTKACIQSMLFSAVNGVLTEGIQRWSSRTWSIARPCCSSSPARSIPRCTPSPT